MGLSKLYRINHKQKTMLFKLLDKLPSRLGYSIYHKMQSAYGKNGMDRKLKSTVSSFNTVTRILNTANLSTEGMRCVELGSGWIPIFPYLLLVQGRAQSVDTFDVNEHYNSAVIQELNDHFSKEYNVPAEAFSGRLGLMQGVSYFPSTDISEAKFDSIDLIVSRFVLEHVPPEAIDSMHERFYNKLPAGSHVLHLISPSDHRAYSDKSLSLYDFLKYSQEEWNGIQTKFDYHNRLRLPQYLDIFDKYFEIVSVESKSCEPDTPQYEKFKELEIHEDFRKFTEVELTAGSINVLLKKKT